MQQAKRTPVKRLLRASASLILIIATAAAASWVIWMPKADLRGVWRTEGYGFVLNVGAFSIDIYETSAVSCLRTLQIPAHLGLIRLVEGVNLGNDNGRLSMSFDGAIGAIRADRLDALPGPCAQGSPPRPGTAQENFDVFWARMDEHYAFFDLHGVDWAARRAALRPGKDEVLTDDALFALLSDALTGLDDEHLTLSRAGETFSPALRPDCYANRLEMRAVTRSSIPGGLTEVADTGLSYGFAAPGVGYVSIAHMKVLPGFGTSLEAFAAKAFVPVAAAMAPARTIIVDIRTNPGGSDLIGLAYAGYFTATPVPVLSKTTRTSTGYSASLHHVLQPQGGPVLSQRVMLALWGMLAQFSYTKMVIVVDADIDARNWDDIAWALATRMDPARDVMVLDSTPMDYLDFASPRQGLAGKIGIDATTKIGAETTRDWGEVMALDPNDEAFAADLLARHLPGAR